MKNWIAFLVFVVASASHAQLVSDSLLIESKYRSFSYSSSVKFGKDQSLIFVLHGSGGSGPQIATLTAHLEQRSLEENFIVVYPNGYKRYWNECRKAANSPPNIENINEEAFFDGMIQSFRNRFGANERNVFVVGMSGGGHMAYKLAMTIPEKIKAITAVVANLPTESNFDCVAKNVAKPVMIINGTTDPLNLWGGGEIKLNNGINLGFVRSTDETFQYWSALARYKGEPVKTALPDVNLKDGETIERYAYSEAGKPEVVLLKVIGGKHSFPKDIDAFVEAWDFFKRQK